MKKNIFLIIGLCVLLSHTVMAKSPYKGKILVDVSAYTKQSNKLIVNADIILDRLALPANDMVTITPVIRALDGTEKMEFDPLIVNGTTRHKVNLRNIAFDNYNYPENTAQVIKRKNNSEQRFSYSFEIDYFLWMRNSELIFIETLTGCNCEDKGNMIYTGAKLELSPPYKPEFRLAYLIPVVEAVKNRSDSYSASLDYAFNKSTVDTNFKNNADVLEGVDRIISEVKNDPNINLNKIQVTGYASPDGSSVYNMSLSERRAKSFTDYLINRHSLPANLIETNWVGEDWKGLTLAIKVSDYIYRDDVLQVIDNTSNLDKRKNSLKSLQNGEVYRNLFADFYPALRRNSYDIFYTVSSLSAEQAKELIHVKPQQLSLNEMFMVANSYEKGSEQFKNAFAIAVKLFPEDTIAKFNSYTSDIEIGSYDNAIVKLGAIDCAEAWNNMGVVLFHKGDYEHAISYFEKASAAGLAEALHNLSQYKMWFDSKDN